jgi:mRNA interferase RelE/StbE
VPTPNLSKKALDFIKQMQHKHAKQVLLKIIELCGNASPPDSLKLEGGSEGYRRVDAGEYRIIYRLLGDQLEILLVGKWNDNEVYRVFSRR